MPDLNDQFRVSLADSPHSLRIVGGQCRRTLDIHVLAGVESGHEVFAMKVLRRGDQDRVNV